MVNHAPVARSGLWLRSLVYVALVLGLSNLLLVGAVDRTLLAPARLAIARAAGSVLRPLFGLPPRHARAQPRLANQAPMASRGTW